MALIGVAFSLGFLFGPMIGAAFSVWGKQQESGNWYIYPAVFAHSSAIIRPVTSSSQSDDFRTTWKQVQSRIDAFWKVWSQEYVTLLHSPKKWMRPLNDRAIGIHNSLLKRPIATAVRILYLHVLP